MINIIKQAVDNAALGKQKIAMFHFQVLMHADALEKIDGATFCKEIGVPRTYKTEFQKMLSLARVMRQQGIRLT